MAGGHQFLYLQNHFKKHCTLIFFIFRSKAYFSRYLASSILHSRDRSGKVSFHVHPVIPLILVGRQNNFNQNLVLKRSYQRYAARSIFSFETLKLLPHLPPRGTSRSSSFISTGSFLKKIDYVFFLFFDSRCISPDIWLVKSCI